MARGTSIEWADATFNPWWGCVKVSPGCENCYAEKFSARMGNRFWGPTAKRRIAAESYWDKPLSWHAAAMKKGRPYRVFVASMADICEDRADLFAPRARLMRLIEDTPALTWLLLTKRPENFIPLFGGRWGKNWPANVWAMTTVENQAVADKRIPDLLKVPAIVRGLSCEPLCEAVKLTQHLTERLPVMEFVRSEMKHTGEWRSVPAIHWVIAGGESGSNARPMHPDWARGLRDQCADAGIPFLFKQWGSWIPLDQPANQDEIAPLAKNEKWWNRAGGIGLHGENVYRMACVDKQTAGRSLDGRTWDEFPPMADR